jgi:hypothetical protein
MTYRGYVKQGVIVLDPPAELPEGAEVEVRPSVKLEGGATWTQSDAADDEALVSGSVAAAIAGLPREDFGDWEK